MMSRVTEGKGCRPPFTHHNDQPIYCLVLSIVPLFPTIISQLFSCGTHYVYDTFLYRQNHMHELM